jgi:hypothetical protein
VRISNELATVKACDQALRIPYFARFDLTRVYDVAVKDTGRAVTVNLGLTALVNDHGYWVEGNCTSYHWFNYDGTRAICDECLNTPPGFACSCIAAQCNTFAGRKVEIRQ